MVSLTREKDSRKVCVKFKDGHWGTAGGAQSSQPLRLSRHFHDPKSNLTFSSETVFIIVLEEYSKLDLANEKGSHGKSNYRTVLCNAQIILTYVPISNYIFIRNEKNFNVIGDPLFMAIFVFLRNMDKHYYYYLKKG